MRALVVAVVVLASVRAVQAAPAILLVGNDHELTAALEDLFYAENTGVKEVGDLRTPALSELGPASRSLADANGGTATVWLQPTQRGATLVTYDRKVDRFIVREVPYALPLNATQAAETARMVRTMLRALREQDESDASHRVVPQHAAHPQPQWLPSVGVGAWFGAPDVLATPMTTFAIAWRPRGLGASLRATLAPASDLTTMTFRGDARETALGAGVHRSLSLAPDVRVTPSVGLGLHRVALAGELSGGDVVHSRRWNPALQMGTIVGVTLPHRLELGLVIGVDCLLRRQRYASGNEQLLEIRRVQGLLGISLGARL